MRITRFFLSAFAIAALPIRFRSRGSRAGDNTPRGFGGQATFRWTAVPGEAV